MLIIIYLPLHLIRDMFLFLVFAGSVTWMAISDMQFSRRIDRLWCEWMTRQGYPLPEEEEGIGMNQRLKNTLIILHFAAVAIVQVLSEPKFKVYWKQHYKIVSLHLHCYNHLSDEEIKKWREEEPEGWERRR